MFLFSAWTKKTVPRYIKESDAVTNFILKVCVDEFYFQVMNIGMIESKVRQRKPIIIKLDVSKLFVPRKSQTISMKRSN